METGGEESRLVGNAKRIALLAIGVAFQKYGTEMQKQQEILTNVSDILMEVLAMESTRLRTKRLLGAGKAANASDMHAVLLREATDRIGASCRTILGACPSGDALRRNLSVLRDSVNYEPVDTITLRRNIACSLLEAERYVCKSFPGC